MAIKPKYLAIGTNPDGYSLTAALQDSASDALKALKDVCDIEDYEPEVYEVTKVYTLVTEPQLVERYL